jgi:Cu+-exporting ATPase
MTPTLLRPQRVTLPIHGLGCGGGGALTIERALTRTRGVVRAYVNPATEMAYVEYDPEVCTVDELAAVVRSRGFGTGEPSIR